jgi:hypothetical protein
MKRASIVTALLAMGLLVASPFAAAQDKPAQSTTGGTFTLDLLGRSDVASSKFTEYREIPKGVSIPFMNLFATNSKVDFNLVARDALQKDQRFTGWANFAWVGVGFDYNQTPHNMGNDAHLIWQETAEGVWSMSQTLRQAIATTADATPSAGRVYPFYQTLLAPTFATANSVDLSSLRQRGNVDLDFSNKLPFNLNFTYMRELKSGYRGPGGGDILGSFSPVVDVPEPLNEFTQDFGVRMEYPLRAGKLGNVHASFNRNIYDNQVDSLKVDNPFRPVDVAYTTATSNPGGGPATAMFSTAPDNEASTGRFGVYLKFKKQTRVSADVSLASWTQNAAFLPYGNNSTVLTASGQPANSTSSLQQPSLNGKINATTMNFSFTSRPIDGLGLRVRYRTYDLTNKTSRYVISGDMSGSPDRSWGAVTPAADAPYGHATANPYDTTTKLFTASASYDIKAFTLEANFRTADLSRTWREATSGRDSGGGFAAVYHAADWMDVRASWDRLHRTAEGETVYGFQSDEAERTQTRTVIDVELTPMKGLGLIVGYNRRHIDFPNRPDRTVVVNGVAAPGAPTFPGTPSGLLFANYDEFTAEIDYTPTEKLELGGFYTYEKDATTNQWSTTFVATGAPASTGALNNLLNYAGADKGNTFGAHALFHIVPDKWTWSLFVQDQKVDGLMDITAKEAAAAGTTNFYTPGRTTLIAPGQGGAADIPAWDDTHLTTFGTELAYHVAKLWTLGVGYWYEKYTFDDAYASGSGLMPQGILIFMKPNAGNYTANVGYAKLTYRF